MARFRLYKRGCSGGFYIQDNHTGKQKSLKTKNKEEAQRLFHAQTETHYTPEINRKIAEVYLFASDSKMTQRTWQEVMEVFAKRGGEATQRRSQVAIKDKAFDLIRNEKLIDTRGEDFLRVLESGTVSTNAFLRKIHNLAFDMDWLPKRILPKKLWPALRYKKKRAITWSEHLKIIEREPNAERRLFYEFLWETGASQGDAARLTVKNIDTDQGILVIHRRKLEHLEPTPALITIGMRLKAILNQLPTEGLLFPYLSTVRSGDRATEFKQRCEGLGIQGISLHSYRYAWAQRAKTCGYPERFAMANLGHSSKAIHRAYAEAADVVCPSLEEYERGYLKNKRDFKL